MSVSIIIPTYNRADLVCEAVESALVEIGDGAAELIVVDDGSTDDTEGRLAQYSGQFRYVRIPNQGVSAARNAGLSLATGSHIRFLDSDDLIVAGSSKAMLRGFEEEGVDAVVAMRVDRGAHDYPVSEIVGDRSGHGGWMKPEHILRRGIQVGSVLFRKDRVVELDGFDERNFYAQDYDLMFRGLAAGWRIFFVPVPACNVRALAGARISTCPTAQDYSYFLKSMAKVADRLAGLFEQDGNARQAFAQLTWYTARTAARDGYRAESLGLFRLAKRIGGSEAETGHMLVRTLYRLLDPYSAEAVASGIKRLLRLPS